MRHWGSLKHCLPSIFQSCQYHKLSSRRPENVVGAPPLNSLCKNNHHHNNIPDPMFQALHPPFPHSLRPSTYWLWPTCSLCHWWRRSWQISEWGVRHEWFQTWIRAAPKQKIEPVLVPKEWEWDSIRGGGHLFYTFHFNCVHRNVGFSDVENFKTKTRVLQGGEREGEKVGEKGHKGQIQLVCTQWGRDD